MPAAQPSTPSAPPAAKLQFLEPDRPIERVAAADLPVDRFLRDYAAKNRPVVISGATTWPAMKKWTPDFFKEHFGDKLVHVTRERQMIFGELIDAVKVSTAASPAPYLHRLFIIDHMPELLADLMPGNPYAFPARYASPLMPRAWRRPDGYLKLLIGGVGARFPVMHYDGENAHAAITEIYGDKEFLLFAPEDTKFVYPREDLRNVTRIEDIEHPDLEKFPLFPRARPYRTTLLPGETIFVPCQWWHTTRVLSPSVSVCVNMLDASNWDGFVAEVSRFARSPARRTAKRALLSALGLSLAALERGARSRLPIAMRLAPVDSAMAVDLREFRIPHYDGAPPY